MKFAKAATHFELIVIYKMKLGVLQGLHLKKGLMNQVKSMAWHTVDDRMIQWHTDCLNCWV